MIRPIPAILAAWALSGAFSPVFAQTPPKNVVVIMTDDQRDYGSIKIGMPKTYRMLTSPYSKYAGVTFLNSFVNFPICTPSRASMLTGLAAHNHGVVGTSLTDGGGYGEFLPWESDTIAVWAQAAGYVTMIDGKYMNEYGKPQHAPPLHIPPGWSEAAIQKKLSYYQPVFVEKRPDGVIGEYAYPKTEYSTDLLARKAVYFIGRQARAKTPFFLMVTPRGPHPNGQGPALAARRHKQAFAGALPGFPRGAFNEANIGDKPTPMQSFAPLDANGVEKARAEYRGALQALLSIDDLVEAVLLTLNRWGLLENTVVIVTSDNGYAFGEHRALGKALPYEEMIRVPLIIAGPGIPRGQTRPHLVNNVDVAATIVDLLGVTPSHPLDGRSLMPIINDPAASWRDKILVQGIVPGQSRFSAVRAATSIYIEHDEGSEEFYDLAADPNQNWSRNNLTYRAQIDALKAALPAMKTCAGATC